MRPDTLSKLAVSVAICAAAASSVAVGLANSRIDDLEIQRDIYKSRAEDWEGTAGVIAQYADDLADELKISDQWSYGVVSELYEKLGLNELAHDKDEIIAYLEHDPIIKSHIDEILKEKGSSKKAKDLETLAFHILTLPEII